MATRLPCARGRTSIASAAHSDGRRPRRLPREDLQLPRLFLGCRPCLANTGYAKSQRPTRRRSIATYARRWPRRATSSSITTERPSRGCLARSTSLNTTRGTTDLGRRGEQRRREAGGRLLEHRRTARHQVRINAHSPRSVLDTDASRLLRALVVAEAFRACACEAGAQGDRPRPSVTREDSTTRLLGRIERPKLNGSPREATERHPGGASPAFAFRPIGSRDSWYLDRTSPQRL